MNAKTKEKKTIMNALLGGEADILVVDPIKYRQMADKECDRIIAIDQGRIVEEGTYDELMSKKDFLLNWWKDGR